MIIKNVSGCMAFSLTVDDKEEIDMTDDERQNVIDAIHLWMKKHPENLNNILQDLSDGFGEYERLTDEPCECCGDYVCQMVLDLKK